MSHKCQINNVTLWQLFFRTSSRRGSSDRRSRSRDRDRSSTQKTSSRRHRSRSNDDYRGSAAAESRESRHYDAPPSSSLSSSSVDRHRSSDKLERDRGDRASGVVENDLYERGGRDRDRERDRDRAGAVESDLYERGGRDRDRERDRDRAVAVESDLYERGGRDRDRERDRAPDGNYTSRSSRRWRWHKSVCKSSYLCMYACTYEVFVIGRGLYIQYRYFVDANNCVLLIASIVKQCAVSRSVSLLCNW